MALQRVLIGGLLFATASARADYLLAPLSNGASERTVPLGGSFTLDLLLSATEGESHNSAILRVVFNAPGLEYVRYSWRSPYTALFDDSIPSNSSLPASLTEMTLEGLGYPEGVVDVELSNVAASGEFGSGVLVSLDLHVPSDYIGPSRIEISVEPDTFALGFDEVPVLVQSSFVLHIPTPGAVVVMPLAWGLPFRRNRVIRDRD